MNRFKLSLTVLLTGCLLLFFWACTRKDLLKVPDEPSRADAVQWLKKQFTGSNAVSLLQTNVGKDYSYGATPEWDKLTVARDATGRTFYYIPLKNDEYALVSGKKSPLKVVGIESYLIASVDAGQAGKVVFFKGDYLMHEKPSASAIARGRATIVQTGFTGKAVFTSPENQLAVYQYYEPSPTTRQAPPANSLLTARTPREDSLAALSGLLADWGITEPSGFYYDLIENYRYFDAPAIRPDLLLSFYSGQYYTNPLTQEQWDRVAIILNAIRQYYLTDGGTGGYFVCETKCHWGASCPGEGPYSPGGVAVTVTTSNTDDCREPSSLALCSDGYTSPWYLVQKEQGSCTWVPGGGSGGGGSIPLPPLVPPYVKITHDLKNKCFIEMYNKFNSSAWENEISKTVADIFGAKKPFNLRFHEKTGMDAKLDATIDGTYSNGVLSVDIDLNLDRISNASQEYIIATMLHESVHAIFKAKGEADDRAHNDMTNKYFSRLVTGLQEMFPNLANDLALAEALTWGGLYLSDKWTDLVHKSPAESLRIEDINNRHRSGSVGTKCIQ